jgi:hypothetical protein
MDADSSPSTGRTYAAPPPRSSAPQEAERGVDIPMNGNHSDTLVRANGGEQAEPTVDTAAFRRVERAASADFPRHVQPLSENFLTYSIGTEATTDHNTALGIDVPIGQTTLDCMILVVASDFDVVDPVTREPTSNYQSVTLDLLDGAPTVEGMFLLRARAFDSARSSTVYLRFVTGNRQAGRIALPVTIGGVDATVPERGSTVGGQLSTSIRGVPDEDVGIYINQVADSTTKFVITVWSSIPGAVLRFKEMGRFVTTGADNAWSFSRNLLETYRMSHAIAEAAQRELRINGLGMALWWELPEPLRDFYWEHMHGKDLSIMIYSDEPYIPWELVKPQRARHLPDTADMLGVSFSVSRWHDSRNLPEPPVPYEVTGFAVIAPDYATKPLAFTRTEAGELIANYRAREIAGRVSQVYDLLASSGVQLIHFAGHGRFDPDVVANCEIKLADGSLIPSDLQVATIGHADHPLVFLNACESGAEGWGLTQIGGWASAFCDAQFWGFVGPYWPVNDQVALKASRLFYQAIRDGATLGRALQTVRRQFWTDTEFPAHPTWLAYSLHSHPNVTLRLPSGN